MFTAFFTKTTFPVPGTAGPHTQTHVSVAQILTPTNGPCPQPFLSSFSLFYNVTQIMLGFVYLRFEIIFLTCWTLQGGADRLSRNVGEQQPTYAA